MESMSLEDLKKELKNKFMENKTWKLFRTSKKDAEKFAKKNYQRLCPEVPKYPPSLPSKIKPLTVPNRPPDLADKIVGLIYGQAVGDTVGLATEFLDKEKAQYYYPNKVIDYNDYVLDRHRCKWANKQGVVADWTDDTDQFLLILDNMVSHNGQVDVHDFAARCRYWVNFGFTELGDTLPLGVGRNFGSVVSSEGFVNDPLRVSEAQWRNGGCKSAANGSVMRTSILGLLDFWDEAKVIENTTKICQVTHFDPRCVACSIVTTLIVSQLVQGEPDVEKIIEHSLSKGRSVLTDESHLQDFNKFFSKDITVEGLELNHLIGYTFKPIACAIYALRKASRELNQENKDKVEIFRDIITEFTLEAGDADTNCAVIGAILGCYMGKHCIPPEWLKFDNYDWLKERINRVLKLFGEKII